MDQMHPSIVDALITHEHVEDNSTFVQLAVSAMDVNELCQTFRSDVNRVGFAIGRENLRHQHLLAIGKIVKEQYDKLQSLLREGLEDENEGPVIVHFPMPQEQPLPAA